MPSSHTTIVVGLSSSQLQILRAIEHLQCDCRMRGLPIRRIAREADLSYETVKLQLPRMEAYGCLRRFTPPAPSRGRPYCYEVLVDVSETAPTVV
jgi:DNA-binding Lrp family transcriptional regulator